MSFIESIANSNMPAAVAFIAVIMLLAAYIVFVVPMMKENDALKQQRDDNDEATRAALAELKQLILDRSIFEDAFAQFAKTQSVEHEKLTQTLNKIHSDTQRIIEELMTREEVEAFISYLHSQAATLHLEDVAKFAQICDLLNSIKQVSDDIKDKQSTLNGALFLSSASRPRGLK